MSNTNPCTLSSSTTAEIIHCNTASEQDSSNTDAQNSNGNINWNNYFETPSLYPSIAPVTPRPTRNIIPFVLRGTLYYDINANKVRDFDIAPLYGEGHLGRDVEYNVGLGGVTVQLVECTPDSQQQQKEATNVVTAVTIGVNVQGRPKLVIDGGNYNLVDIEVSRSYYINVKAPTGYLLTGGVCNDDFYGWQCLNDGSGQLMDAFSNAKQQQSQFNLWQHEEKDLGISEGRSSRCVSVDEQGLTDSLLDIGVMRLGDTVTFVIGQDIKWKFPLEQGVDGDLSLLLEREELEAIGFVVAELFAVNLQKALVQRDLSFVQLDSVVSVDVQYSYGVMDVTETPITQDEDGASSLFEGKDISDGIADETTSTGNPFRNLQSDNGDENGVLSGYSLSVYLVVKGHYNKGMNIKLGLGNDDTAIEELIQGVVSGNTTNLGWNDDNGVLYQEFRGYNSMCLEQIVKMNEPNFTLDDYSQVHTSKGVIDLSSPIRDPVKVSNVFSVACADGNIVNFLLVEEEVEVVKVPITVGGEDATRMPAINVNSSVENEGVPLVSIIIGLVCGLTVMVLLIILLLKRRSAKKKLDDESDSVSSTHAKDKGDPLKKLVGLVYNKKVISEGADLNNMEAGMDSALLTDAKDERDPLKKLVDTVVTGDDELCIMESGGKLKDEEMRSNVERPSSATDATHPALGVHEGGKVNAIDELNDKAIKSDEKKDASVSVEFPNLEAKSTSNLDMSDSGRSKKSRRTRRKKSNSDFANDPIQTDRQETLRRSVCDLDIGTKRMQESNDPLALILGEAAANFDDDKKLGRDGRGASADNIKTIHGASKERRKRRDHRQNSAKDKAVASSSRRRARKHDPLRQSTDDSNIGLRSHGTTMSTLNDAPKASRRSSRKSDPLRMSKDDSNIGLRSAVTAAAVANDGIKKHSRRKNRKRDPLRMSKDDSNVGLRTAVAAASVTNDDSRKHSRRSSRKSDPLRMSKDDSNIGLRSAVTAAVVANDGIKKHSRRKSRKQDQLRMSKDDSNIGLRTAVAAAAPNDAKKQSDSNPDLQTAKMEASKIDSSGRRKKGRRQGALRRSRCDLDIGTKRDPKIYRH